MKTLAAVLVSFMAVAGMPGLSIAEEAYAKTPSGEIGIKTVPAAKLLVTESPGSYFEKNDQLFSRLFSYIRTNNVAMTTPVEAEIENAAMRFYVGEADRAKNLRAQGQVRVVSLPERTVAAIGIRGSYSQDNFEKNRIRLEKWVRENAQYVPAGDAYAVYWNGPMMPWFMKHSEVHLPVIEKLK